MEIGTDEGNTWGLSWQGTNRGTRFYLSWLFPVSGSDSLTLFKPALVTNTTTDHEKLAKAKKMMGGMDIVLLFNLWGECF